MLLLNKINLKEWFFGRKMGNLEEKNNENRNYTSSTKKKQSYITLQYITRVYLL